MAVGPDTVLRYIHRLVVRPDADEATDSALLGRFASEGDARAFAALVDRHGPLVLHVCRRVLGDVHDAEDAFQAVFLVLARKAAAVHRREALAAWLHGVARRVALNARSARARQRRQAQSLAGPCADAHPDPLAELSGRELLMIIDEELQRLPEVYRLPVMLCCLEGRSLEEAARQLGWTPGSVKGRLERGRARLHDRLLRRGLTLSAALAVAAASRDAASAAVGARLAAATVRGALLFAARSTTATGIPAQAAALAGEVIRGMALAQLKTGALLLLVTGLLVTGFLVLRAAEELSPRGQTQPGQESPPRQEARSLPAVPARPESPTRTDHFGDPLPAGALARVGSVRLRQGSQVYCLAFSPDGRFLASGSFHGDLCLWDRATGKLVRRFVDPFEVQGGVSALAFSPDGQILASNKGKARLWEVGSGKLLRELDQSTTNLALSMAFSPDGRALALGTARGVWFCDPATGQLRRPIPGYTAIVPVAVFSKDGKVLATAGTDNTARIWDLAAGEELRRFDPKDRVVDVALAPDGTLLAAQTPKEVLLWEVATGREVRRFPAERPLRSLAFSPDGTRLASANKVWDVTTGQEVCRLEGVPGPGWAWGADGKLLGAPVTGALNGAVTGALAFAPDGTMLATGGGDGVIRLHDPASGRELPPASDSPWNRGEMIVCGFSPDGRWLAVQDNEGLHLCETDSGREIRRLPRGDDHGWPVALAPDGRTMIAVGARAVYQWDTATGRELRRIPCPRSGEDWKGAAALAFAPDGRTFACAHHEPTIRLWDTAKGMELGQFPGQADKGVDLFFSPDGRSLAASWDGGTIQLWDVATRKELRRWPLPAGHVMAFAPDGRTVAVGGKSVAADLTEQANLGLVLYDLLSGKEMQRFGGLAANSCTFSPDGRLLAVDADPFYYPDRARTIQLLEVASGQVRARFAGHFGFPGPMVFSPDGQTLATGSSDTTALIWDVTGWGSGERLPAEQPSAGGLQTLWADLAAADAQAAHRAVWTLTAAPGPAVALVKEKLRPAQADDDPRIERLIAGLDSDPFAVREKAAADLEGLGDGAEPTLRNALAGDPSPEARRRIEHLLGKLETSPRVLQERRAVETLEHIATSEAGQVLQALARGAPGARLTQEAKASLDRLNRAKGGR
jgi:RNA polymerase sigma factor (sigma-70 family)